MQSKEKALGGTVETLVAQVCEALHLVKSMFLFFMLYSALQLPSFREHILNENYPTVIKIKKRKENLLQTWGPSFHQPAVTTGTA